MTGSIRISAQSASEEKTTQNEDDHGGVRHLLRHSIDKAARDGDAAAASPEVSRQPSDTTSKTEEDTHDGPNMLSPGRRWALIAIVAFTMVMSSGGQQGLNIALPVIQEELGILGSDLQWISSAYALSWGCLLLVAGRLADVYGRKLCFISGIAWYAVWCLGGGFMKSGTGLIVTRALAGAGAAMGIPASMGLIAANIHGKQRATAFAVFSAGAPLGGAMGIVLGGVLTAYTPSTWRAVLWIFTGLAALICIVSVFIVPPDPVKKRAKGQPKPQEDRIDWIGAAIITSGLVLVQFTVSDGMSAPKGWRSPYIPTLFVLGVILVAAFFFWEYHLIHRTPRAPLLRLALFTRAKGRLAAIYFVGFVMWMGFISIGYHGQLYYQQVQMTGTVGALLRTLPTPISGLICNFVIAQIVHHVPGQLLICVGLGATGLSATFFAVSSRTQNYWTFPFQAQWLMVIGADFLMPVGTIFVSRMALPSEQSVAGALFQTLLQLGGSFGLTLTSVIAVATENRWLDRGVEEVDALLLGLHASFWLSAGLCYFAMLLAASTLHGIGIVSKVTGKTMNKERAEATVEGGQHPDGDGPAQDDDKALQTVSSHLS